MRISVAMATYNGERFLAEQLRSLAQQTRVPDELVICDDGSTDRTVAIAEDFARSSPFATHVHRNPSNLGYSANFAQAISRTTGDVIFICDQDDVWFPEKVERVSAAFAERPDVLAVVNNQLIADSDGKSSGATIFGNMRRTGLPDTYLIAGSCTAVARPLLQLLLPNPEGIPYDSWIGSVADLLGARILIEEPLQIYRRHGGNATDPDVVASPSRWAEFRKYSGVNPIPAWRSEIGWRSILAERLQSYGTSLQQLLPQGRIEAARSENSTRIKALLARISIIERPRLERAPAIIRAWCAGCYGHFSGIKSAGRDLLRR